MAGHRPDDRQAARIDQAATAVDHKAVAVRAGCLVLRIMTLLGILLFFIR